MKNLPIFLIIIALSAVGIFFRLIEHPANFTPMLALSLFAGTYLSKKSAILLPLAIMFITDLSLGFYDWRLMATVYGCLLAVVLIGQFVKSRVNLLNVITASLGSAIIFFLVTNFAVWALSSWYPHTLSGLIHNYVLAAPFFKNTLLSTLLFSSAFFGLYEILKSYSSLVINKISSPLRQHGVIKIK